MTIYKDNQIVAKAFNAMKSVQLIEFIASDATHLDNTVMNNDIKLKLTSKVDRYSANFLGTLFIPILKDESDYLYTDYAEAYTYVQMIKTWEKLGLKSLVERRIFNTLVVDTILSNLKQKYNIRRVYV